MNSVALITGASRGIGRGIALELAGLGWDVMINYVVNRQAARATAEQCQDLARENGKSIRATTCQADVGSSTDRKRLLAATRRHFRRLDLLVNNAGVAPQHRVDILEGTEESFDRLLRINAKGPYFLTQLAARWMIEQVMNDSARPDSPPKIVTISSVSAYAPSTNRGDYCTAKAALAMLTPLFAARLAEYGIRVYEIRPGIIATDMTAAVRAKYNRALRAGLTPLPRWGTPADVARAVAAIAMDLLPFSTGEVINVDGGFHLKRL